MCVWGGGGGRREGGRVSELFYKVSKSKKNVFWGVRWGEGEQGVAGEGRG